VKAQTNVALSLPKKLLRRFRVFVAAWFQTQKAKRRFVARIRNAPDRGAQGKIQWTRDELHARRSTDFRVRILARFEIDSSDRVPLDAHAIVVMCQVHSPVSGWDSISFHPPIPSIPAC
jgi:hypothetical protein